MGLVTALTCAQARAQTPRSPWEEARAAQVKAARQAGLPTTPADLPAPVIPADQNAATYLAKIRERDKAAPVSSGDALALGNLNKTVPTPEEIALGRKVLEAHRERLHLIHQVAQSPAYWEPTSTLTISGIPVPNNFPHHAQFRDHARWLLAESRLLLNDKKPLDAVQTTGLVFHLAHQVASDSSVLSFLVSTAVHSMALNGLRTILYQAGDNAEVAEAVSRVIEGQGSVPTLRAALRGEVLPMLAMSDAERKMIPKMLRGTPGDSKNPPFKQTAEYRIWTKKYHYPTDPKQAVVRCLDMNDAHFLEWMRRILPLVDLPYPQALSGITAIVRESEKHAAHPDYTKAAVGIANWAELPAVKARQQANAETVRMAAALLAWKAQQGHFPETLAECGHPAPLDPFDQQTLRYRKEGTGFLLYSVGKTGKFDGGQLDKKPSYGETLFRYPRPGYLN